MVQDPPPKTVEITDQDLAGGADFENALRDDDPAGLGGTEDDETKEVQKIMPKAGPV